MDEERVAEHLRAQAGVVARRQVLAGKGDDNDIERLLRRRLWARVHDGVYVDHTGPLSWRQRAWAAVLLHEPAALAGASALHAWGVLDEPPAVLDLVVAARRRVVDPPGVRTRRSRSFAATTQLRLGPPRERVEHAALAVASSAVTEDGAAAVIGQTLQSRRTTAVRLSTALETRRRLPRRRLLLEILDDAASGAHSALERRYLTRVERAHHLPSAERQSPARSGSRAAYRDVEHAEFGVVVELDGRLGHEQVRDRWADLARDLRASGEGLLTLRAGWGQVLSPCRLAEAVGAVLRTRGWTGEIGRCPECPETGTVEVLRHPTPEDLHSPSTGAPTG